MKKIAMTIIVANTMLAIGCAKQKESIQTNDAQPGLIKGRVGKSIQLRPLQIIKVMLFSCGLLTAVSFLYSFTLSTLRDDFLKQLGISKTVTDEKITQTMLFGSMDTYGIKSAKSILLSNRTGLTKQILVYTKSFLQSAAFKKEYEALQQKRKPVLVKPETPEEIKEKNMAALKKAIAETTATLKKVNAAMKPVYEKMLADGNKQLAEAEDPNNKQYVRYAKTYPQLVKEAEERYQLLLSKWESEYPSDHMQFLKRRLEDFLVITSDIDFNAALITKNGRQVFVNPDYERKDDRWKMAFRAGKEVVEPARAFVQQWLNEGK